MRAAQHHTSVRVVFLAYLAITLAGVPASRAEEDVTPPTLVSFSFAPTSVDVTTGPATVTVTVRVTDDLSGFNWGCALFRSPSAQQSFWACYTPPPVSGTLQDGVFQLIGTIPQFAEGGAWTVERVDLGDEVGNYVQLYTADLEARGFPISLTVTSAPDTTPPGLEDFDFAPSSVDVAGGPATVTVTVHVTDDLSGFNWGCALFRSPSAQQSFWACYTPPPVSGTLQDGVFQLIGTIPQFAEGGAWTVERVDLGDGVGNYVQLYTADLEARGWPTQLIVSGEGLVPAAPQGLAGRTKDYKVNLTWQAAANADSYRVFRKLNGETAFSNQGVTGFTVFVDYLPAGTASAQYYVVAENSFGASPPSATITVTPAFR